MDEIDQQWLREVTQETHIAPIKREELNQVEAGKVVRALTDTAMWLIEVTGLHESGCVEGRVTCISENPLQWNGLIAVMKNDILRRQAIIGGFASKGYQDLVMEMTIPGRSPVTTVITSAITSMVTLET